MHPVNLTRRGFLAGAAIAASSAAFASAKQPAEDSAAGGTAEDAPHSIRFGVTARQVAGYSEILALWQEAEAAGFDTAFVYDHFMPLDGNPTEDCCYDGWALLAALAGQTRRLRLGVLVSGNTYRSPAIVAKMAATVDHVSGGRVIVGLGAGWMQREHVAFGIPFYTKGERARRLVESVEVIKMLFTQETSTFEGKYYTLKNAPFMPKPLQKPHPPILIGGMGPKVIQPLAARHAQIWHFGVPGNDPDKVRKLCENFDRVCREVGRDPMEVEKATSLNPADVTAKPIADVKREIRALVDVGVGHFILFPPPSNEDRDLIRRFGEEIIPEFRIT